MRLKTKWAKSEYIIAASFLFLTSLGQFSKANVGSFRSLSLDTSNTGTEDNCSSEKAEAKRRACEDGRNFACAAQKEIEDESKEMDQGLIEYMLDHADKKTIVTDGISEIYYFFDQASLNSLKSEHVASLLPVTRFTSNLDNELRKLMDKKFDGGHFFHHGCYHASTFADKCERVAEDEYDDWCEDGLDIVEDLGVYKS